eukprot:CAMPEP_0194483214 /NCGR_PEP_ID=MMETSP0253-20130528/4917_1 /TAXON_ID=2966 /ORGANISM="Noctiluca scintillans" /LENGTH=64 /DNA_ID=CAMNT_0039322861 /DNA_START=87 /DNA_END=278 /DNA_ORIENTATION=-
MTPIHEGRVDVAFVNPLGTSPPSAITTADNAVAKSVLDSAMSVALTAYSPSSSSVTLSSSALHV